MDNTSLFRFNFVDRKEQKQLINDFLKDKTDSNVLWIHGLHGVGKSFLLNNINNFTDSPKSIYIELHAEDSEPNCLLELLKETSDKTQFPFLKFFKNNYMEIVNIIKNAVVFTTKQITNIDLSDLTNSLFDSTKIYISNKNAEKEQQNAVRMISCYLNEILSNSDLLIILDNFSLCDKKSLPIIIDIILNYQNTTRKENGKIYFVLSTTSDVNNDIVSKEIKERIPNCSCELREFKNVEHFYNILNRIFDFPKETVNNIFELCHGNPQRLKDFIHKLYDKNGISLKNNAKPTVNLEIVNDIISKGTTDIKIKELNPAKRIILSLIVFLGKSMTSDLITEMTIFTISKISLYPKVDKCEIVNAIFELINENIIVIYHIYDNDYIKMEHDLKFECIKYQLENEPFKEQINESIYIFLVTQGKRFINHIFTEEELNDSIAFHAYVSKIGNWQTLNLNCAINKYKNGLFPNAIECINRIYDYISKLDYDKKIIIADCYFQNGNYLESEKILKNLYKYESNKFSFNNYCLYAKVENILINKKLAFELADEACHIANIKEEERLKAIGIKLQSLINSESQRIEAKKIFDDTKKMISVETKKTIVYSNFLISTVEFYRGEKAQNDLKEAKSIAIMNNDYFLLSTIYFNMGFDDFWEGNFVSAKDNIQKSYEIFIKVRQHESAYSLNNLAALFMIENNIDEAIRLLYKALVWAQTDYAQIVIKTQLMVCFSLLLDDYCLTLADEIRNHINSVALNDLSAYIKFNYNCGFIKTRMGMKEEANVCFYNVIKEVHKTNPQNLPHTWIKEINVNSDNLLKSNSFVCKDFVNERFDPWLLTLNHY